MNEFEDPLSGAAPGQCQEPGLTGLSMTHPPLSPCMFGDVSGS